MAGELGYGVVLLPSPSVRGGGCSASYEWVVVVALGNRKLCSADVLAPFKCVKHVGLEAPHAELVTENKQIDKTQCADNFV